MQHFKEKYRSIKSNTPIRDKNDPFRGLDRVDPKAQIYPLEVDQIPVKAGENRFKYYWTLKNHCCKVEMIMRL